MLEPEEAGMVIPVLLFLVAVGAAVSILGTAAGLLIWVTNGAVLRWRTAEPPTKPPNPYEAWLEREQTAEGRKQNRLRREARQRCWGQEAGHSRMH